MLLKDIKEHLNEHKYNTGSQAERFNVDKFTIFPPINLQIQDSPHQNNNSFVRGIDKPNLKFTWE